MLLIKKMMMIGFMFASMMLTQSHASQMSVNDKCAKVFENLIQIGDLCRTESGKQSANEVVMRSCDLMSKDFDQYVNMCSMTDGCIFSKRFPQGCLADCRQFKNQAQCSAESVCKWEENACGFNVPSSR